MTTPSVDGHNPIPDYAGESIARIWVPGKTQCWIVSKHPAKVILKSSFGIGSISVH